MTSASTNCRSENIGVLTIVITELELGDIGGHVDFMLGAIDQGNVDVFQVFRRRVVNGMRRIGGA